MTISSPEREAKKVKIAVDRNPVETNFDKWACDLKKGVEQKIINKYKWRTNKNRTSQTSGLGSHFTFFILKECFRV